MPEVSIPGSTLTPADILVDNFSQGFPAALDFSISHALRPSCNLAGVEVGKAASQAAEEKIAQYEAPCATCHWKFVPVCLETTGFVCGEVSTIIGRLCRSLSERNGIDAAESARLLWSRLGLSLFSSIGTNLYRAYHPSLEDPPPWKRGFDFTFSYLLSSEHITLSFKTVALRYSSLFLVSSHIVTPYQFSLFSSYVFLTFLFSLQFFFFVIFLFFKNNKNILFPFFIFPLFYIPLLRYMPCDCVYLCM